MTQHTVSSFDTDLKSLTAIVFDMGLAATRAVEYSTLALQKRDAKLAQQLIANDRNIDDWQHKLEERAIGLIARRQPVAGDLREIVSAIRIAYDLERIGDLAKNLAKRTLAIAGDSGVVGVSASLTPLASRAHDQLTRVMKAYRERDDKAAMQVWEGDKEIDALHTSLFRELLTYMMEDPRHIGACTHLLFCAKNLERIGDHATNIAETVHYIVTGQQLTTDRPRAHDTAIFCRMLLNRGELDGKRYLSEAAIAELSKRQTPATMKESYGLGFSVGADSFGHGGAHATNMEVRPGKGLVIVWMVQHGGFPGDGAKAQGAFKAWAVTKFGN